MRRTRCPTHLVARRGFTLETHNVSQSDGWTVSIHRIVVASNEAASPAASASAEPALKSLMQNTKVPVLLPCFLLGSSPIWLVGDRNTSLAYILADSGFDVWLGNYRGNTLFSSYAGPNTFNESKWAFTVNDHALYDTPSQIDYILNVTGQPRLHIAGMSQGAISSIQMFSLRPEYQDKVISFASLAGARTLASTDRIPFMKYIACLIATQMDEDELLPWNENFASLALGAENETLRLAETLVGLTPNYINSHKLPLWIKYLPGGTSTWTLRYYYELWRPDAYVDSNMSRSPDALLVPTFDYGIHGNSRRFQSESPITMDARLIKVPTKLYFSSGDKYCTADENWKLLRLLPSNSTEHLFIDDANFSHFNFAINDHDPFVFYDVASFLSKFTTDSPR